MLIELKRKYMKPAYTIGTLSINGHWMCDTLEPRCIDWKREKKIPGQTAIPAGKYRIVMKHSPKFGRQMPYLEKVPRFTGVMIHTGNTVKHTQGCILVGYNTVRSLVLKSKAAFDKILEKIDYARKNGQEVWIRIEEV